MKLKKIYTERLLKFADHLAGIKKHPEAGLIETVTLYAFELENTIRIPYDMRYHYWVFAELPVCFDDWYFEEKYGNSVWEGIDSKEGTVASVIDFFDLSLDELGHLFDIDGFQHTDRFGGVKLTETSNGADIARNILDLIKIKRKNI